MCGTTSAKTQAAGRLRKYAAESQRMSDACAMTGAPGTAPGMLTLSSKNQSWRDTASTPRPVSALEETFHSTQKVQNSNGTLASGASTVQPLDGHFSVATSGVDGCATPSGINTVKRSTFMKTLMLRVPSSRPYATSE